MVSKQKDEFNPWHRSMARTGQARLTIERHGHQVTLDGHGVSIDGHRILRDDPSKCSHGFHITPRGTVVYRDQEIAAIDPPEDESGRGEVTVWGKGGPSSCERREREEAERRQRDHRYSAGQQHRRQLSRDGQEMTL